MIAAATSKVLFGQIF